MEKAREVHQLIEPGPGALDGEAVQQAQALVLSSLVVSDGYAISFHIDIEMICDNCFLMNHASMHAKLPITVIGQADLY